MELMEGNRTEPVFEFTEEVEARETTDSDFGEMKPRKGSKKTSEQVEPVPEKDGAGHEATDYDETLPKSFPAKYLGKRDAAGLWGIRYTRKPVDAMVKEARELKPGTTLPYLKLTVSENGVQVSEMIGNQNANFQKGIYPIHMISYGVQDLVYTRVFAMITVRETNNVREHHPFTCHAFVCDSTQTARNLTFALASAFKLFSMTVKAQELKNKPKRFAIDLRSPEELQADYDDNPVDDSEA